MTMFLLLLLSFSLCFSPSSSAIAPSPSSVDCTTELLTLADCLEYVTGNGSVAPSSACCSELASVVSSSPICLCQLFNTSLVAQFGITINYTAADELPSLCKVAAPSRSECPGASLSPAESPSLAPSPEGAEDCAAALFTLTDCLDYVTGNGSVAAPSKECCKEFSAVVENEPICLCQLFNTSLTESYGLTLNYTASLALPAACSVTTPPPSTCAALGIPVPSPTGAPSSPSQTSGGASPPGQRSGLSTTPPGPSGSGASKLEAAAAAAATVAAISAALLFV